MIKYKGWNKQTSRHTDRHINTMTRTGLRAGLSENSIKYPRWLILFNWGGYLCFINKDYLNVLYPFPPLNIFKKNVPKKMLL